MEFKWDLFFLSLYIIYKIAVIANKNNFPLIGAGEGSSPSSTSPSCAKELNSVNRNKINKYK